ncbi:MAG: asparagine synthetase B, partial [Candidatus Omnitrophica bacterium]|nr:asparagine synthetase B [Candidatus Omnitrophota bacterium]
MCGIAGIYRPGQESIERGLIKKMTDAIAHRGPDGEGHFIDRDIALGHRRLAVLDLTPAGNQPMLTADRQLVVSYNGEIYNFRELRRELENLGYRFNSRTDTEVILHGYREWGLDLIPRLNGMFAFALWDAKKRELILARDRYGIKPLYLWKNGKEYVFASEIKAILQHPGYRIEVNYDALNEYFTFQNIFRFHTFFKGIDMLPPARIIRINNAGESEIRTYWDYNFTDRDSSMTEEDACEETL